MADERQANNSREGGNEGGREGRRRYFRRRQRPAHGQREGQGGREQETREGSGNRTQEQPHARRRSSERQEREDQDFRQGRSGRRRRTRGKSNHNAPQRNEAVVVEDTVDTDNYVPPTNVFIYTHVSRPGSARDSYEFRSEHFSKVGRRLEDYTIDLSTLFSDAASEPSKEITLVADLDETE